MRKLIFLGILSYVTLFMFVSCKPKEGEFFHGSLGLNEGRVILSSSVAGTQIVTMYDLEGNLITRLHDYTAVGGTPRGLANYGALGFIVAVDGLDQFDLISIDGTRTLWGMNVQVPGAYYDIEKDSKNNFYMIDANTIEKFDSLGNRLPPTGATPYIGTTIGGCVLSTPVSMTINANGKLAVASNVSGSISIYNLTATPTCVTNTAFGNNPRALLSHSNGSLYVVTQANTQETLWRADANGTAPVSLFANNTSILQDGFAMAELPSGNILISSSGTDAIVEFNPAGEFVRIFDKDANTNDVYDIIVLGGN